MKTSTSKTTPVVTSEDTNCWRFAKDFARVSVKVAFVLLSVLVFCCAMVLLASSAGKLVDEAVRTYDEQHALEQQDEPSLGTEEQPVSIIGLKFTHGQTEQASTDISTEPQEDAHSVSMPKAPQYGNVKVLDRLLDINFRVDLLYSKVDRQIHPLLKGIQAELEELYRDLNVPPRYLSDYLEEDIVLNSNGPLNIISHDHVIAPGHKLHKHIPQYTESKPVKERLRDLQQKCAKADRAKYTEEGNPEYDHDIDRLQELVAKDNSRPKVST